MLSLELEQNLTQILEILIRTNRIFARIRVKFCSNDNIIKKKQSRIGVIRVNPNKIRPNSSQFSWIRITNSLEIVRFQANLREFGRLREFVI
jgi:hypothetical protein